MDRQLEIELFSTSLVDALRSGCALIWSNADSEFGVLITGKIWKGMSEV